MASPLFPSVICASLWLVLGAAPAKAAPELLVNLKYDVDPTLPGCMSESEFRALIARHIGYDPHRADAALGVEVRVRPTDGGIEGAIDWTAGSRSRSGERRFDSGGRDCSTMLATMGFALAVQIQLLVKEPAAEASASPGGNEPAAAPAATHPPPAGHNNPALAAAASPEPMASQEPPTTPSPSTRWSAIAGVGPSAGFGLGPDPIAQGRLFVALGSDHSAVELGVEASLPSTTRQNYGGGFRHQLLLGTAAGCALRWSSSLCALVKLGQIGVQGVGVDRPASADGFLAQVGLRLGYSLRLGGGLALFGHADALYLLTAWTVDVNRVAVWSMPRLAAVAGIDLTVRFW